MKIVQSAKFKVQSLFLMLSLLLLGLTSGPANAAVTLAELLASQEKYNGKEITYQGEVIGDVMVRQDFAWFNLHDGTSALGIFCPAKEAAKIKYTGGYQVSGDIVSAQGVFHYSCKEHGGDTDIHAQRITMVKEGAAIIQPQDLKKTKASIILAAVVLALAVLHWLVRRPK